MRRLACVVLFLVLITGSSSKSEWDRQIFGKLLEQDGLEERLTLLGPRNLLKNHKQLLTQRENEKEDYTCARDLAVVDQAIFKREKWALKMLDASSKIPSGLLEGNIIDLGMYDECINARGESLNVKIRGQHCMYSISVAQAALPINPTLSICVPSSCTSQDIVDLFNGTISTLEKFKNLGIQIASVSCSPLDSVVWDTGFIVCNTILGIYVVLLIACSLCEAHSNRLHPGQPRHPLINALSPFALQKNASAILSMEVKEGTLPVIHGIRFFSLAWVVLGHQSVTEAISTNVNIVDIFEWMSSWRSLYVYLAQFAVDTFFTMSGFLMTYVFLKKIPKLTKFNVPLYYLHRYIRLTPGVVALIVFIIVYLPKLGSGPRWEFETNLYFGSCPTKWWPNLLYVQNFFDEDTACLGHLWYLAADMQLYWISPLILFPLHKRPKIGLIVLTAFLIAALITPATIIGVNKYPMQSFVHSANISLVTDAFKNVYEMSYGRAAPWLIGIYLGFEIVTYNRRLSKITMISGWLLTLGAFAFCTFGTRSFIDPSYVYNPYWETFFTVVSRPIWACAVCWIIYASIYNCAGPIARFLSCKFFLPLSRLSYCTYLVHIVLQVMRTSSQRTPSYFSNFNIGHSYLSDFMLAIMVAFVFCLLFESPVVVLEKKLFRQFEEPVYERQKNLALTDEEMLPE